MSKEIINQLCILCCVLCVVYHSTVLCQQSKVNFFNKIFFFHKNVRIYFVLIIICFLECCRFLNVCMQCSVDVTESVVELLRVWCRCAVIPLVGLSRRSAGRWCSWHVMQPIIKLYLPTDFKICAAKNSAISRL